MTRVLTMALVLGLGVAAGTAAAAPEIGGRWLTASGNLEVEIAPCGAELCGTVARVVANHSMSDPTKEMADRPALGLAILTGFTPAGAGEWEGQIYDREHDKTYRCVMWLDESGQLEVRPYIGIHLIGKTQRWTRVAKAPPS